eukprot:gene17121-biopygen12789
MGMRMHMRARTLCACPAPRLTRWIVPRTTAQASCALQNGGDLRQPADGQAQGGERVPSGRRLGEPDAGRVLLSASLEEWGKEGGLHQRR